MPCYWEGCKGATTNEQCGSMFLILSHPHGVSHAAELDKLWTSKRQALAIAPSTLKWLSLSCNFPPVVPLWVLLIQGRLICEVYLAQKL